MVESVVGTVVDKAMDAVLRKVSEGKKLSTEDLVILTLGLFRETSRRIDELYEMMSK
jgi:N6-adenosine-specific RNA methylase IME4